MEKTLQQQYVLIKEGKGSKDDFLKSARRIFPDYITPTTDFKTAVNILKNKSILNEGVGGIVTQNSQQPDWFKIFDTNLKEAIKEETYALSNQEIKEKSPITNMSIIDMYNLLSEIDDIDFIQEIGIIISRKDWNNRGEFAVKQKIYREIQKRIDDQNIIDDLEEEIYRLMKASSKELNEAIGVKNTKEYGNQNSFDKIDKEVEAALSHQFDNKDTKNIDNVYGQSFLMGYYTEMKDPQNEGKTVDELKQIVLKNMTKDINYYHTEASFGVKGIGYKKDVVGGGEPKAPKGKYKSSGYGDLKENKETYKENTMDGYSNDALRNMIVNLSRYEGNEDEIQIIKTELKKRLSKNHNEKSDTDLKESYETSISKTFKSENEAYSKLKKEEYQELADFFNKEKNTNLPATWFQSAKFSEFPYETMSVIRKFLKTKNYLKENKPGTQKSYNQEIDWIKYEVDYVPDNKEVYEKWPEPYKSKALKALEYRKRNFRNMSKDKLDSLKENKDTDLKIYQSELNMLNKIKPTGEKQLKRKKELEDKIASLQTNESKIRSLIHNLILEELNEVKRIAVSTEIKEIEKTNEALALEAKIKSIDEAIEKRQAKLNLAESEELAEMIDKNMVKTLQKEIKELEKYKAKASKMYEKMIGSTKKEVIDETLNEDNDFGGAGLLVYGRTKIDNDLIDQVLEEEGYYGIFNARENYWFFPEGEETIDQLENNLENIFIKKGINARFEGQFNETLNGMEL
jgi:hypothetical protein